VSLLTPEVPYLTEAKVREMIEKAESSGHRDYKELTNNIWLVFSNPDSLNKSFLLPEGEVEHAEAITVDVGAVRRTYVSLFSLELESVKNTMVNAMEVYCSQLQREKAYALKQPLNHFVVLFENPLLHSPEFVKVFPKFLQAVAKLPVQRKELLIHWYSNYSTEELRRGIRLDHCPPHVVVKRGQQKVCYCTSGNKNQVMHTCSRIHHASVC